MRLYLLDIPHYFRDAFTVGLRKVQYHNQISYLVIWRCQVILAVLYEMYILTHVPLIGADLVWKRHALRGRALSLPRKVVKNTALFFGMCPRGTCAECVEQMIVCLKSLPLIKRHIYICKKHYIIYTFFGMIVIDFATSVSRCGQVNSDNSAFKVLNKKIPQRGTTVWLSILWS